MNILDGLPEEKLTPEQENALAVQKDIDSLNRLVEHNLREAFLYSRKCYSSLEEGESLQACYDGLMKAAKRFQPNRIRFFAYAKADIRGALTRMARTHDTVRRGPKELVSLNADNAEPLDDFDEHTIDTSKTTEPKSGAQKALLQSSVEPDFDGINSREVWSQLEPAIAALSPEERLIIELHFKGNLNLREIGTMLRLSRARIQQVKHSALQKIKLKLVERP